MGDQGHAIVGLKMQIKTVRGIVRELKVQNERWRKVAHTLRDIAALDEDKFRNLLRAQSLPCE
jgi:hypothetical protein